MSTLAVNLRNSRFHSARSNSIGHEHISPRLNNSPSPQLHHTSHSQLHNSHSAVTRSHSSSLPRGFVSPAHSPRGSRVYQQSPLTLDSRLYLDASGRQLPTLTQSAEVIRNRSSLLPHKEPTPFVANSRLNRLKHKCIRSHSICQSDCKSSLPQFRQFSARLPISPDENYQYSQGNPLSFAVNTRRSVMNDLLVCSKYSTCSHTFIMWIIREFPSSWSSHKLRWRGFGIAHSQVVKHPLLHSSLPSALPTFLIWIKKRGV